MLEWVAIPFSRRSSQPRDRTQVFHIAGRFFTHLSHPREGNGNPLQHSCLENPRDRGAWWAAVCGVAQSWTWLKRLSSSNSKPPKNKSSKGSPRILELVAYPFSRGSSQPRNWTGVSCTAGRFFTSWATHFTICGNMAFSNTFCMRDVFEGSERQRSILTSDFSHRLGTKQWLYGSISQQRCWHFGIFLDKLMYPL